MKKENCQPITQYTIKGERLLTAKVDNHSKIAVWDCEANKPFMKFYDLKGELYTVQELDFSQIF